MLAKRSQRTMSLKTLKSNCTRWEIRANLTFQAKVTWIQLVAPVFVQMTVSIPVLLQDKLKEWPHAGPLQSGLAWTIATLCWSIPRFFLARPRPADDSLSHILPRTPVCLRSAGAQLHMISRALGIKSRTVSKDPQNTVERTVQASDTGNPLHSAMASLACGTGACRWHYDSWLWWLQWHHEWNDVGRPWNSFAT